MTSVFQTKIGIRNIVMPGARMQMIVVMKLTRTEDGAETGHPQAHDPQVAADAGLNASASRQRRVGEPAEVGRAGGGQEARSRRSGRRRGTASS